jgi:hypothetical protein
VNAVLPLLLSVPMCLPCVAQAPSATPQDPPTLDPNAPRQPMPLPIAFACRRNGRAIEVDGSLVDWPELPAIDLQDMRQLSGTSGGAWRSPADCSAVAFLLWDGDHLWFAASVKDEWHRALDPNSIALLETPVADSILLSIDPLRDTRSFGPDPRRADDSEFWLSEEASHEVMRWDRYRGTARVLDDARLVVSHDREQGITTYEAQLPWKALLPLGKEPKAGLAFDLQLVVSDFDESTDPMPQTRIGWTFGCGVTADAALLGTAMLLDDGGELKQGLPTAPDRLAIEVEERLQPAWWKSIADAMQQLPPQIHDGKEAPEACGGLRRLELLQRLDDEIARHPRVDFVEFCQRVHRRMSREVAAAEQRGLPFFWDLRSQQLAEVAATAPPKRGFALSRLPQGGWLVRAEKQSFLVDPAGADIATRFWAGSEFVLLTESLDMSRRNDQLLLRMAEGDAQRPFYAHIAFHLPRLLMNDMPLIAPGQTVRQANGAEIEALGEKRDDGQVAFGMGYRVDLPGPHRIVFCGPSLRPEDLPVGRIDALVLSPRNPQAVEIAQKAVPDLIVIEDAFGCFVLPNAARVDLRIAHRLQKDLLPLKSILLAPGETWAISRP